MEKTFENENHLDLIFWEFDNTQFHLKKQRKNTNVCISIKYFPIKQIDRNELICHLKKIYGEGSIINTEPGYDLTVSLQNKKESSLLKRHCMAFLFVKAAAIPNKNINIKQNEEEGLSIKQLEDRLLCVCSIISTETDFVLVKLILTEFVDCKTQQGMFIVSFDITKQINESIVFKVSFVFFPVLYETNNSKDRLIDGVLSLRNRIKCYTKHLKTVLNTKMRAASDKFSSIYRMK